MNKALVAGLTMAIIVTAISCDEEQTKATIKPTSTPPMVTKSAAELVLTADDLSSAFTLVEDSDTPEKDGHFTRFSWQTLLSLRTSVYVLLSFEDAISTFRDTMKSSLPTEEDASRIGQVENKAKAERVNVGDEAWMTEEMVNLNSITKLFFRRRNVLVEVELITSPGYYIKCIFMPCPNFGKAEVIQSGQRIDSKIARR